MKQKTPFADAAAIATQLCDSYKITELLMQEYGLSTSTFKALKKGAR